jgi:hypothetical protein
MKNLYVEFNSESPANLELLQRLLTENICTVNFTKVNGESRTMPCTLRKDVLPIVEPVLESKAKKERKTPETSISVWCTDKNCWRSFRLDSIHSISVD